jgi:hypothetical protein
VPRSLTILFPDGRAEFWLTALVFAPGDKLEREGKSYIVTSIGDFGTGDDRRHMTVTVRLDHDTEPQPWVEDERKYVSPPDS